MNDHNRKMATALADTLAAMKKDGFSAFEDLTGQSSPDTAGYRFVFRPFAKPGVSAVVMTLENERGETFSVDRLEGARNA